ncbi:aprataxin and PNK-like factor isoform X2 [Cynocephalus volans]|uniref:aprataxin and PNK-like factor isoform X2 n=1 Tax=Cynocephalus volans TaxID=110931 RepID=UPI002FC88194
MSGGFELQPQDGGPPVALTPGETVIGRGPLLGITDKRVSRRHAILEVVGGQLRIKPVHTNPCFYQSSKEGQLLPLKTNLWHWLNPGDSFSLLADKYIFHVFSTHSETEMECTLRNSQMFDEDNILNETPKSPVINLPDETTGASQLERSTEITKIQTTTTNSVEMSQSFSAIKLSNIEMNNMKTNTLKNKIPVEELGEVSEHKIVTKGTPNKDETVSCSESCSSAQGKSLCSEFQGSHPESTCDFSNPETLHAKALDSVPQGTEENKVKRSSCMYGTNCYRKNPVHFQHFSHPGDSDYGGVQVMDQDETDDRPECPYGASCYRKNPQHKIEYRHNTLPIRSVLDEDNDNVGQPNEYDLSDSFLDDEEEEYEPTDEDSDWEPGKEDQEKEDVEELVKEAKKFMKRKK